ncbi:MAG TPA: FtsQ-type POTRA domain-containing protein [Actinomycetales bacterium]|jgi:cell division protein FtsQ
MTTTRPTRPPRRAAGASPASPPVTRPGRPSRPGSTTSPLSLTDRLRAVRRRRRRPSLFAVCAVLVGVLLLGFLYAGPALVVREATVSGVSVAREQQVRAAAAVQLRQPLAQVDTGAMADRVRALPFVEQVAVSRSWPSTLRLDVTVRTPAAVVPSPSGTGYQVVDASGVPFASVATPIRGRPVISVGLGDRERPALRAALAVVAALPPDVRATVGVVSARTPDDVRFKVGSATVVWGGQTDSARKASVFAALRKVPATVYDLSSPNTPVLR